MLRQIARLTRGYPAAGPRAAAVAVYEVAGALRTARESGEEGVACVDDAARALVLFCDLYVATGRADHLRDANALLDFVLWMQRPDGRFVNFVHDWEGTQNVDGLTSAPGGPFWQARGLRGLAKASLVLDDPRAGLACRRALDHVDRAVDVPADVRAVHVTAALDLLQVDGSSPSRLRVERWCDEIAAQRRGDVLLDSAAPEVHLWAHSQEAVLAQSGGLLARPDLIEVARRSAEAVFVPVIASEFDLPSVQPYGVACAVMAMDALALATRDARYAALAHEARAWFDGRNPARAAVYDRDRGRIADGIDGGRVSLNSGAESNIVGAQALLAEVSRRAEVVQPL